MNSAGKLAVLTCVLAALSGCRHNVVTTPPPVSTAPPAQPSSITHVPVLPTVPPPTPRQVGAPGSDAPPPQPAQTAATHQKRKTRKTHTATPSATATADAAAPPPAGSAQEPGVSTPGAEQPSSVLGQLSAGNGSNAQERAEMSGEIHEQQVRLEKLKRPLSSDQEAVALQVRSFLSKAEQAVTDNDLDGARTLTTKARVLIDELSGT